MIEAAKIIGAGLATTRLVGAVVNIGALIVAVCLVLEIITGVTLAMHYNLISILSTITCLVMWTNILYVYYRIYNIGWIMISIVRKNTSNRSPIIHKYLNHSRLIELIWTITPALIIILIAFPSFKLLYLMNEVSDPAMSVSAEGHQWYWSYQYPDFLNANDEFIELDTYLVPELDSNSLNAENGNNFNEGGGNPNPQGSNHDPQGSDPNPEGSDPNPQGSNPNTFKGKGKEIEVDDTDTSKGKGKEVDEFESFRDPPQGETTTAELRNPNAKDYDPKYHGGRKVLKQYDDKGNVLPGGRQPYTDKQGRPILAPIRTLSREWIFYSNAVEPTTIVSPPNLKDILGKK